MAAFSTSGGHAFDSIIPLASGSAASSSGTKPRLYGVFINHCGQDVKHTLASSIYNSLNSTGLRVFLDEDELKLGDLLPTALKAAIAGASIHIAIFSEHYAQYPWCLNELDFMLRTRATIIPVFYHVEPSDLRWAVGGKGIYADAFSMYERKGRYDPEEVKRWKMALHQASFYAGQIITDQDDEQKVVKNVVNRVLEELKVQLDVATHPVGLDETVQDFDEFALQSAGPIQIVGIWGMGGVGKTTLAKELYNRKCSTVDRSSFLFDVREAGRKGLLHEKQKKLLEDLDFKSKVADFDDVEEGKEILKSHLTSVSTLMVLDDVDHPDQLDVLLPARESLGQGSLIIVTTRELLVLKAWGISAIYKIRRLNASHAEELFCWHAFRQPSPLLGFEDLAKKFINACHGLPLSLKVLGSQLYGESNKNYWQSQLEKLSRMVPDDIKLRLKISYDALDKEEREMFLDIACFFIGCRSSLAIAVWDGSEWNGFHGWQRLVNKCLVELDEKNLIRMHDHLRDLGREIANQQSPYRLWSKSQIIEIRPQQEAIGIRGMVDAFGDNCYLQQGKIIIHTSQGERRLAPRLLGLKIFVGNGNLINQEHSELSRELVWLQCNEFEHKNIPSWLPLRNFRILELFNSRRLEYLWERDEDVPFQLRELVIKRCNSLRGFPRSIARLRNLQKIIISQDYDNCDTLSGLPQEFCHLQSLEHLEIKWCRNLSSLPSNFGELTNLQHLNLNGCTKLELLPDSFEKLLLLEYLNLQGCGELIIKSRVLENMTKLRYFNLDGCRKLEELRLPEVASLTKLYLKGTSLKELPANIFQQTKLTELVIGSAFLTTLPTSLRNLFSLEKLEVHTSWKAPRIVSLEHSEILKWLVVVANDRSVVEPFIGTIQKWPREVITCTRSVFDVGSLKNSFQELPNVSVLDYSDVGEDENFLELRRPESSANANAILICLIIDCVYSDLNFYVSPGISDHFDTDYFNTELDKGKWAWMGVFTQGSEWLRSNLGIGSSWASSKDKVNVKVEEAWLVMAEEGSILEAFSRLFQSNEQRVVKEMKVPLEVSTHPVALDEAVQEFETIALQSAGPIQIVGIAGMGGSGKTMLAKEIYNMKYQTMRRSTFLFDVRDAAVKGLLVEKQKKLLQDLGVKGLTFDNEEQGKRILQSRLRSVSVLIILDDVNHRDQLEALLPAQQSLGVGSLIIVTTRDLAVLKAWGISAIYQMRALNDTNAKQLFCWHAFLQPSPVSGFEDLVDKFITASHGLPLSLEVLGEQVRGKSMSYWLAQLNNNSRKLPANIKQRLKISYDALDEEEKQMFLDTACFFIGEENSLAIAVWEGSEWNGLHGWESLSNKHLVYLNENNRITMHDHLRDLGRELADQLSPYRLWSSWQLNQIQPQQKHIEVRGLVNATGADFCSLQRKIIIDRNEGSRSLMPSSLGLKLLVGSGEFRNQEVGELSRELLWLRSRGLKLLGLKLLVGSGEFRNQEVGERSRELLWLRSRGLKLLVCSGEFRTGEIGELSRELLWLRWDDFNYTNLPPWLSLKNLRVLELNGALNLQELWTDDAHAPLQLRELIITGTWSASFERFPSSISYLKFLKKISLLGHDREEFGIKELPEEFCDLQSLEHLELRHCKLLSTLPTRFGELRKLWHLDLFSCEMLRKLPDSFKQLVNLKYLDLSGCKKLSPMPDILESMRELEYLHFSGCPKLQELPLQIAEQKNLRELHLKNTMLVDVPNNIDQLSKLETLVIGSLHLTGFPPSLGNLSSLTCLKITRCIKLESLPESVERLKLLEYLCIKSSGVRSLPEGFRQLTNLRSLKIFDCPIAELDLGSGSSSSLGKLKVIHLKATDVTRLTISQDCCPNLETLQLELNCRLMEIEILSAAVKMVKVYECTMLRDIKGIPDLVNLETFEITGCPEIDPDIAMRSAVLPHSTGRLSYI